MTTDALPVPEEATDTTRLKRRRIVLTALVVVVLAGAVVAAVILTRGDGIASPAVVASAAGATSCDNSGFYTQNKLSGEKDVIYDCRFAGRLPECVTYSGNIASDATSEVQIIFSDALNASRPPCLREHRVAAARLAAQRAAAALARKRANYKQTLVLDREIGWHSGYSAWNGDPVNYQAPTIYWRWMPGTYSCPSYDSYSGYSCWKIKVVTRHACSDLSVELGESNAQSYNSPQVGSVYGEGGSVQAEVPSVIEVDGDSTTARWASVRAINCY